MHMANLGLKKDNFRKIPQAGSEATLNAHCICRAGRPWACQKGDDKLGWNPLAAMKVKYSLLCYSSPQLCVGFLFLILYPAAAASLLRLLCRPSSHSHNSLSYTIFHTDNFDTHLSQHLSHTNFVTHTHQLSPSFTHTHTTLSHTIFHTHHFSHTNFVTHHLSASFTQTTLTHIFHNIFHTHNFVTHHLPQLFVTRHLSHRQLWHTSVTTSFTHQLCHTHTNFHHLSHINFVTHHLSYTPSFTHQLCHPPSFTIFHHLSHRQLWHTSFTTSFTHQLCHTHTHQLSPSFTHQLCHTPSFIHTIFHTPTLSPTIFHHLSHRQLWHTSFTTSFTHQLCHTHTPTFTIFHTIFVTHHLSYTPSFTHQLCHPPSFIHTIFHTPSLSHTIFIFHHTIFRSQLCHTPSFTTPSFTHTTLSHTIFRHTIFHIQLCHTQPFFFTSRSSTISFVFPSFPIPLQHLLLIIGRSWRVGLSGSFIFSLNCSTYCVCQDTAVRAWPNRVNRP